MGWQRDDFVQRETSREDRDPGQILAERVLRQEGKEEDPREGTGEGIAGEDPGWGRQHHSQRDPPFVPSKRLPDWASLELSPSAIPDLQCGIAPLGPPASAQAGLLGRGGGPPGRRPWP